MKAVLILAALSLSLTSLTGCESATTEPPPATDPSPVTEEAAELEIVDVTTGSGPAIEPGATAIVHYTGWLFDGSVTGGKGRKFDSSRDRGQPFAFPLGGGRVIQGWDQGVAGMQVGGLRRLVIPADLAYGERGAGGVIPPGATLLFEVELLGIEHGAGGE